MEWPSPRRVNNVSQVPGIHSPYGLSVIFGRGGLKCLHGTEGSPEELEICSAPLLYQASDLTER